MTFFLRDPGRVDLTPRGPDRGPSSFVEGLGGAFSSARIENDANFMAGATLGDVKRDLARTVRDRLGDEEVMRQAEERGLVGIGSGIWKDSRAEVAAFRLGRALAAENPDAWVDHDFTEAGVEAEVNRRLQERHTQAREAVDLMPGGAFLAGMLGGMAGTTADVKNLPFLLLGGGSGSLARIIGREAALNVAAEAAFLPSQFEMAKRLGIPDPDVTQQLAMAAVAGGIIGGAVPAAQRGYGYFRGRNEVPSSPRPQVEAESLADRVEDALATRHAPAAAVNEIRREAPPVAREDWPNREPLFPEEDRGGRTVEESVALDESAGRAVDADPQRDAIAAHLADVQNRTKVRKRPLADYVKRQGGLDPDGVVAGELKARGLRTKDAPGLFRRGGLKDVDNLVRGDAEEALPGLGRTIPDDGNGYLDRDSLIEALIGDIEGRRPDLDDTVELREAEAALSEYDRLRAVADEARESFLDPEADRSGPYWRPDSVGDGTRVYGEARDWMHAEGYGSLLSDGEMDEIASTLARRGGGMDDVLDVFLAREAQHQIGGRDAPEARGNDRAPRDPVGDVRADRGDGSGREAEGRGADAGRDRDALSQGPLTGIDDPLSPEQRAWDDAILNEAREALGLPPVGGTAPAAKVDPDKPALLDTRGSGVRFHGSREAVLDGPLQEGAYSSLNIYGQGFYSTDAVAIADGYNKGGKGGGLYVVEEVAPVRAFDLDQPVPDFINTAIDALEEDSALRQMAEGAREMAEGPSLREFYDSIREESNPSSGLSADDAQDLFDILAVAMREQGYGALDHKGGLGTKKAPHAVRIYLDPHEQIAVRPVDAKDFAAPAPDTDAPDAVDPEMVALIASIDADDAFVQALQFCGVSR